MTKKIIFSAGGTGGHIFPAINLMKHFFDKGYKVLLVTDNRGKNFVKNYSEFKSYVLKTGTPTNKNLFKKFSSFLVIFYSIVRSVIILKKQNQSDLYIDTWVMSCRVFSRGMEDFIHNEIVSVAQSTECKRLLGEYIPTKKNKLVSDLYKKLGYDMLKENNGGTMWELKVFENHSQKNIFIERVDLS